VGVWRGTSPVVGTVGLGAEEREGKEKDTETNVGGIRPGVYIADAFYATHGAHVR